MVGEAKSASVRPMLWSSARTDNGIEDKGKKKREAGRANQLKLYITSVVSVH